MRNLTISELKAGFAEVISAVQAGESIIVCYGRKKRRVAALVPYAKFSAGAGKRRLGTLKEKASFTLRKGYALSDKMLLTG